MSIGVRGELEHGLPGCLQRDLDAFKKGKAEGSSLLDCLWGEVRENVRLVASPGENVMLGDGTAF